MTLCSTTRRGFGLQAALTLTALSTLSLPIAHAASPADLTAMVRFDALYIPLLSMSSAAQTDTRAAPKAVATAARLRAAWPDLQRALAAHPPATARPRAWAEALRHVGRQLASGDQAVASANWKQAHEALEDVRIVLMQARQAAGMDYFVDRLTAYHEPMEVLALAGATWAPTALDSRRRAELDHAYGEARALWRAIELHPVDPQQHGLSAARAAQLRQGLLDETAALSRLSDALRGTDNAALLAAAKAIKPPFARVFTAFGLADGEALPSAGSL
jgi:hypothetical protein